jgi:hypothetical protein
MPYIMEKQKAINEDFDKKRLMELKNYKKWVSQSPYSKRFLSR